GVSRDIDRGEQNRPIREGGIMPWLPSCASGQGLGHQAVDVMVVAAEVAGRVHQHGQQVHPALLALVAGRGKLAVVPRCRINEPAPARGVVVEPDGGSQTERRLGVPATAGPRAGGGLAAKQGPHRPLLSVIRPSFPPGRSLVRHPTRRGYGVTLSGPQLRVTVTRSLSGPDSTRSRIASSPSRSGSRKNQSCPRPPVRTSAARSSWTWFLSRNAVPPG